MKFDSLKDIRSNMNLSTTQVSYLLGVNQSTVVRYEQSEMEKTISLATLEKYAESMGFQLKYSFSPKIKDRRDKKKNTKIKNENIDYQTRRNSAVSNKLKSSELDAIKKLGLAAKLNRAYELSVFLRKLSTC